jgi:hypothetical protein
MKIHTEQLYDGSWMTTDENYDGAPDAGEQRIGYGSTAQEAIDDYNELI